MGEKIQSRYLQVIAGEWAARAPELTAWTWDRLVNRVDCWTRYLPIHGRKIGKDGREMRVLTAPLERDRGERQLTRALIERHFIGESEGHLIGLHAISPESTSRWFAVDVDRHGTPNDAEPEENLSAVLGWYRRLFEAGFDPLLTDSNGIGGHHLIVIFSRPVPTADVFALAQGLVADWKARGLNWQPETYPRRGGVEPGHRGAALRLMGRHHTREQFTRIWADDPELESPWLEGNAAIERILGVRPTTPEALAAALPIFAAPTPPAAAKARRTRKAQAAAATTDTAQRVAPAGAGPDAGAAAGADAAAASAVNPGTGAVAGPGAAAGPDTPAGPDAQARRVPLGGDESSLLQGAPGSDPGQRGRIVPPEGAPAASDAGNARTGAVSAPPASPLASAAPLAPAALAPLAPAAPAPLASAAPAPPAPPTSPSPPARRPVVCVDLDGVLARYEGWRGLDAIGEPLPGAVDFTRRLSELADVVVHTTRCTVAMHRSELARADESAAELGALLVEKVRAWLDRHGFRYATIFAGQGKPPAHAYVDDRAVPCRPQEDATAHASALAAATRLCTRGGAKMATAPVDAERTVGNADTA